MKRWCEGPCGRELPLDAKHFVPTGGTYVTKDGQRRQYLTHKCRRCRAVRAAARGLLPSVARFRRSYWRRYHAENRAHRVAYMRAWKTATGYRRHA